jgi:FtsX-like permease family
LARWTGLSRIVIRGLLTDWPLTLAVWLLLTCATTMLVAGLGYADAVAEASLRHAVAAAPGEDRGVTVETSVATGDVGAADAAVTTTLRRDLAGTAPEVVLDLRSPTLVVRTNGDLAPAQPGDRLTLLASYGDLEDHASLIQGRWTQAGRNPIEATLSEPAARAMGVALGDVVSVGEASVPASDGGDPPEIARIVITGIWRADPADAYWLGDPLDLNGVTSDGLHTTRGPFMAASADLLRAGLFSTLNLRWQAIPSLDALRVGDIDALRQNIEALPFQLRAGRFGVGATAGVGLAAVLETTEETIRISASDVTLLALMFALLAGYTILLASGMLAERRRGRVALLRARGASAASVTMLSLGEAAFITLPATVVALLAAPPVTAIAMAVGPLAGSGIVPLGVVTANSVIVAALAGLASVAVLTLPHLGDGANLAGVRARLGRPLSRTLPRRLGLDVVLAVVAIIGLWQLRVYGSGPSGASGAPDIRSDPLVLAAPALGLLAGAVLATRLVPRLAELAERAFGRRRGLLAAMVTRQVARRPLRYTRVALLLVLAAAVGTFTVTYLASWSASQSSQAAYAAAGDIRATAPSYASLPAAVTGSAYRAIPGVTAAVPVVRESVDLGRTVRGATLLSLDPGAAARVVDFPADGTAQSMADLLPRLAAARPRVDALAVAGEPKRLAVTMDVDLVMNLIHVQGGAIETSGTAPFDPGTKGVGVSIVVLDGDGRLQRFDGGSAFLSGAGQRIEVPLTSRTGDQELSPAYPLRLEAIELTVSTNGAPASGSIDLREVAASADDSGDSWQAVPLDPGARDWQWLRTDATNVNFPQIDPAHPGRVTSTIQGGLDSPIGFYTDTMFRLWAPPATGAVPGIASEQFLAQSGTHLGDSVTVAGPAGERLTVQIVGSTTEFPPLDPATPFLVVDGMSREMARLVDLDQTVSATEWWLTVAPGSDAAVAQAVAAPPIGAGPVVVRGALAESYRGEPVALGVLGALLLGSFGALAFAVLGTLATAMVSVRERLAEMALLRAVGLSQRQLHLWLSIEQAFLLGVGLVTGVGLGLVLAWLTLPFAVQGPTGAAAVPSPALVAPWQPFLALAGLAAALLAGILALFARQLPGEQLAGVLRAVEE